MTGGPLIDGCNGQIGPAPDSPKQKTTFTD